MADVYDALRTIQTLARVALASDNEEVSVETLAEIQRGASTASCS
jgi:hypothetical protein